MGRTAIADERLWSYLQGFNQANGYVVGLIIGQSSKNTDYVVHLARTPPPTSTKDVKEERPGLSGGASDRAESSAETVPSVKEIKEAYIADHAKHVTRMLPGGMWVLGLFLAGPNDPFGNQTDCTRLRNILRHIRTHLQRGLNLDGDSPSDKLLLHVNIKNHSTSCRSVDLDGSGSLKPAEWKFQKNPMVWHELQCTLNLQEVFQLHSDINSSVRRELEIVLETVKENVTKSFCLVDDDGSQDPDDLLENINKKSKGKSNNKKGGKSEQKIMNVNLYLPMVGSEKDSGTSSGTQLLSCSALMNLIGSVASRVYVHQKATIYEATAAVKQDLIRSVGARFEMHLDSLIEEESGSPEELLTLHEPPRRVMIPLPYTAVTLSDYLFPGEGAEEALLSSQELLDLAVDEEDIEKDVESQAEAGDWESEGESDLLADEQAVTPSNRTLIIIICVTSCLIALLAVLLQMSGRFGKKQRR